MISELFEQKDKNSSFVFLDGGLGTMLHKHGLKANETPEDWNLSNPESVLHIHREYADAGAEILCANTFGANPLKYQGQYTLSQTITAGVKLAREAAGDKKFVALDIGPTGRLLKPSGDLDFDRAYNAFAETVRIGADAGADVVLVETMSDTMELKAAVLAAKENSSLPVMASVTLGENGKLLTGADIECVATLLESLDVAAYGFNCALGPDLMLEHVKCLSRLSSKPIIVKPNAGLPKIVDGKTVFAVGADEFAGHVCALAQAGAKFVGGCCGTTPEHIAAVHRRLANLQTSTLNRPFQRTVISSGTASVEIKPGEGLIVGERINPTGKKRLKEAFLNHDSAYLLREAIAQCEAGAKILDVNCGVPGIDEAKVLPASIEEVQSVTTVPIQIDSANALALENALRRVNGKALVNSVNGKRESMDRVFPLVKRYGGCVVALCLDDNGIPGTAEERIAVARKILAEGSRYGLSKEDFVFDALTLAVSTDDNAAKTTLETVRRLNEELGVNTILGISNVSFGLPGRIALNNAMYTLARKAGLSAAIANPSTTSVSNDDAAFDVLLGRDPGCKKWIAKCQSLQDSAPMAPTAGSATPLDSLTLAIKHGLKEDAKNTSSQLIAAGTPAMEIIGKAIVPALEEVGKGFEEARVFLPQLLMAADAAGAAFDQAKIALDKNGKTAAKGLPVVLATVKGDIHDIGKNIVRALLESYGFKVIDLGKDVAAETIVETARQTNAMMIALSALMTTTLGAMAETIALAKASGLACTVCVGGAVVNKEYADEIGADFYAKDAMQCVRFAESLISHRTANP